MKIFVSYSRSDAGDFADQIQRHIGNFGHYEVFIDERSIGVGEIWSHTIETNISNCDIFVAIITYGALRSRHVEKEVLQAQTEKKTIIPCFHRDVRKEDIKWGLNKIQGIVFKKEFDLARDLYTKLKEIPSPKPVARTPIQPEKRRWLLPIIIVVIAAVIGLLFVPVVQKYIQQQSPEESPLAAPKTLEPTPTPTPTEGLFGPLSTRLSPELSPTPTPTQGLFGPPSTD